MASTLPALLACLTVLAAAHAQTSEPRRQAAPSAARALIGTHCTFQPDTRGPVIPGYTAALRFQPVILPGGVIVVRQKDGVRYAFLAVVAEGSCVVRDVITLPTTAVGGLFLQCSAFDPPFNGFGLRNLKTHGLDALWSVDADRHTLSPVPTNLPGVRCQQPEAPE